jgi:cAMP-binding proteins - catabolite gene activator and regulatory subunit of cAMP-dependent protein kinases
MTMVRKDADLFTYLPAGLVPQLFEGAVSGEAKAGSALFSEGEEGEGVYVIDKGLLKIVVKSPAGGERIVTILGPGAIVGELAIIDGLPRSASAVVMQDCEFRFVNRTAFATFTAMRPHFYRELVKILSMRLREADKELAASTFLSGRGRLARALIELAEHFGQARTNGSVVLEHKISNADLAAMTGLGCESVSHVLTEWRERKLVTQTEQYHHIHDMVTLKRETSL